MATLSHLVTAMAWATGVPRSTVFAYGRFAREGGLIAQKTRGPGAAVMSVRDAANLLIAVCGTDITRNASDTIKEFRPLKGTVHVRSSSAWAWLSPLGLKRSEDLIVLKPDFGSFLEFLIESSASGALYSFLSKIPFDRWPPELLLGDKLRDKSLGPLDNMAKLRVEFFRKSWMTNVRVERWWRGSSNVVVDLGFVGSAAKLPKFGTPSDLRTSVVISAVTLAAVGFTIKDKPIPRRIRRMWNPKFHHFFTEQIVPSDGRGSPSS
jgi:hypothetical protein